ncbi:DegT/DnrJ/EryC1/StrS family aminotransferase [Streptomyces sp. NPDC019937]|uniref:DegT/DnrJ/EryC1/StrS family aminotransferase n=1 Tax=Streptomyces sp. NPDC019937 TaxID=3154787 RepID=UPI003407E5FA
MDVPFLNLRAAYLELKRDIDAATGRVLDSGRYLLGPELAAFETEWAAYCGARHCVAVGSGCDALELALRAMDIGPGDEVIVPAHTFAATWLAVSATGAEPVAVEPEPATFTLDPERVEAAIISRTRAILPVHLYGHPADLAALSEVAERHGVRILEDAAQAHGAQAYGRRVGAWSTTAFSFYPGKNLGGFGDGGAVVTDDAELAERVRLLRNYGSREKYRHEIRATNSRLDELQAAVLRVKLAHLDAWTERRAAVAARYLDGLAGLDGPDGLVLPRPAPWAEPVWHLFVIRSADRSALRERLAAAGVETLIHYPVPVHRSEAYAGSRQAARAQPVAERLAREVLSLPMGPHLSDDAVTAVIEAVRSAVAAC